MNTLNLTGIYNHGNGASEIILAGDVLTFDGLELDLSLLPDGATATDLGSDFLLKIERVGNNYTIDALVKFGYASSYSETIKVDDDWALEYDYELA